MKSQVHKQSGFTLVEIIVAIAIASLVLVAATSIILFGYNTFNKGNRQSELQANTRLAIDYIDKQIKYAGTVAFDETSLANFKLIEKISVKSELGLFYLIHEELDLNVDPEYHEVYRSPVQVVPGSDQSVFSLVNGTKTLLLNVNLPSKKSDNTYQVQSQIAFPNIRALESGDARLTQNSPTIYFAKGLASLSATPFDDGGGGGGGGEPIPPITITGLPTNKLIPRGSTYVFNSGSDCVIAGGSGTYTIKYTKIIGWASNTDQNTVNFTNSAPHSNNTDLSFTIVVTDTNGTVLPVSKQATFKTYKP